jgi:hypothetical protein
MAVAETTTWPKERTPRLQMGRKQEIYHAGGPDAHASGDLPCAANRASRRGPKGPPHLPVVSCHRRYHLAKQDFVSTKETQERGAMPVPEFEIPSPPVVNFPQRTVKETDTADAKTPAPAHIHSFTPRPGRAGRRQAPDAPSRRRGGRPDRRGPASGAGGRRRPSAGARPREPCWDS